MSSLNNDQILNILIKIFDGDWGLGPIPNPQSPIPNPHFNNNKKNYKNFLYIKKINYYFY